MQNETVRALKDIYETQCLHAKNLIVLAEAVNGAIAIIKQNPPRAEGEYEIALKILNTFREEAPEPMCTTVDLEQWLTSKIAEKKGKV